MSNFGAIMPAITRKDKNSRERSIFTEKILKRKFITFKSLKQIKSRIKKLELIKKRKKKRISFLFPKSFNAKVKLNLKIIRISLSKLKDAKRNWKPFIKSAIILTV